MAEIDLHALRELDSREAGRILSQYAPAAIAAALAQLPHGRALDIVERLDAALRADVAAAGGDLGRYWLLDQRYPHGTVGRLIEPVNAVMAGSTRVRDAIELLRTAVRARQITYVYITADGQRLIGVVTFRELLYADAEADLASIMVANPYALRPQMPLVDAMREVVKRHFPVYPVVDDDGVLLGIVRGQTMFEEQAFDVSAQAGSLVGVEREERISTPWRISLRFRQPWLQLNLLTAFVAGATVGIFQNTINQYVLLAIFLPVLSGQAVNTAAQTLAITLRGMTLGELEPHEIVPLIVKEAVVGFMNGALVGVPAALSMWAVASWQGEPQAALLAGIVLVALAVSCLAGCVAGAVIPLTLRRLGADPATAGAIFLSTLTDIVSMGLFLWLAWLLLL